MLLGFGNAEFGTVQRMIEGQNLQRKCHEDNHGQVPWYDSGCKRNVKFEMQTSEITNKTFTASKFGCRYLFECLLGYIDTGHTEWRVIIDGYCNQI